MEITELKKLVDELEVLRAEKKQVEEWLKSKNEQIRYCEKAIIEAMEDADLTRFEGTNYNVTRAVRGSSKIVDREAFFRYLEGRGLLDDMITVHSETLKSFCRVEQEHGEAVPGIETTENIYLHVRKK